MTTSLQILLMALLVGGGIGGYHMLTADSAPDAATAEDLGHARQIAALEKRIQELEGTDPHLQGTVDAQALWDRMQGLGERVKALEEEKPGTAAPRVSADLTETSGPDRGDAPADEVATTTEGVPSPLTKSEEQRVRELVNGAMRNRMEDWANRRMDRTLKELGIELADDQREKLNKTLGDHMRTVRDTFRKARDDGLPREERGALLAPLNEQLTRNLSEFLPVGDAEAITNALPAMGRGPGSGRGGFGGGPPR